MVNVADSTGFVYLGLAVCDAPLKAGAGHLVPQNPSLGWGRQPGRGAQAHQTLSVLSPWRAERERQNETLSQTGAKMDRAESSREGSTAGPWVELVEIGA